MITKFSWRRAVAVPAVVTLALGGALLSTTAAQAVDSDLVVTSPAVGDTTDSRLVTVAGTAIADANVIIKDTDTEGVVLARTTTDGTGAFSTTIQYPDTANVAQTIFVDGEKGFSGFDPTVTRSFTLPAVAPAEAFSVTAPTAGQQLASRTVTFSGTGNSGSTVNVLGTDGNRLPGTGAVAVVAGQWSLEYTYPETEAVLQSVRVVQVTGASGSGDIPLQFVLPSSTDFAISSPVDGSTTQTRNVEVSGTGTPGAQVSLRTDETNVLVPGPATVLDDGSWTAVLIYSDTAAAPQTVFASEGVNGDVLGNTQVSFTLAAVVVVPPTAVVLDAPVITSPTQGQVVVGDQVTFEGTGTPGSNILLAVVPTDQLDELEAAQGDDTMAAAAAEPADPADPIVVDAAGNWTVTLALTPNDYTAAAVAFLLDADGLPVLDDAGQPIISDPSADVAFSLIAAVTPAALPVTPVTTPTGLAFTGSEGTEAAIGIGAAVLLLGATLMVLARRRAKLATTDVAGE